MDKQRKQELKAMYINEKPERGIVCFKCVSNGHIYLKAVEDTRGRINSIKARLDGNMYLGSRNRELQQDWRQYGEEQFEMTILETLKYDENITERESLEELQMLLEDYMIQFPDAVLIP